MIFIIGVHVGTCSTFTVFQYSSLLLTSCEKSCTGQGRPNNTRGMDRESILTYLPASMGAGRASLGAIDPSIATKAVRMEKGSVILICCILTRW